MPRFRVKNLNVSLADQAALRDDLVRYCTIGTTPIWSYFTCCHQWPSRPPSGCHYLISPITCRLTVTEIDPCGYISPYVELPDDLVINPAVELERIEEIRADMEMVMKALDERGVELKQRATPKTRAEAEMLEKELTEALEEVRAMKDDLE